MHRWIKLLETIKLNAPRHSSVVSDMARELPCDTMARRFRRVPNTSLTDAANTIISFQGNSNKYLIEEIQSQDNLSLLDNPALNCINNALAQPRSLPPLGYYEYSPVFDE